MKNGNRLCITFKRCSQQRMADAASSLKSRLDKVSSFHATFTQKSPMAAVPRCRRDRVIYGLSGQIYSTGI